MDILPTEVVFYQTLLLVINFYLKLSNFIINYQSLLKTNKRGWMAFYFYSTVTLFARLRGLSTSQRRCNAA